MIMIRPQVKISIFVCESVLDGFHFLEWKNSKPMKILFSYYCRTKHALLLYKNEHLIVNRSLETSKKSWNSCDIVSLKYILFPIKMSPGNTLLVSTHTAVKCGEMTGPHQRAACTTHLLRALPPSTLTGAEPK